MLNDQLYKFYNLDFRILITSHENDLYNTDSWVTSVNFNSKKVHEDKLFGRKDILQFFSRVFTNYEYTKPRSLQRHFKLLQACCRQPA